MSIFFAVYNRVSLCTYRGPPAPAVLVSAICQVGVFSERVVLPLCPRWAGSGWGLGASPEAAGPGSGNRRLIPLVVDYCLLHIVFLDTLRRI